jgi:hypothetical protein
LKCVHHCENGVKLNYLLKQDRNLDKKKKKWDYLCEYYADPCYQDVAGGGDSGGVTGAGVTGAGVTGAEVTGAEGTGAGAAGFFFAFFTTFLLTFFLATFFLAFFGKDKFHLHYYTIVVENSINVCSNPKHFVDNLCNAQSCKRNRVPARQLSGSMLSDE